MSTKLCVKSADGVPVLHVSFEGMHASRVYLPTDTARMIYLLAKRFRYVGFTHSVQKTHVLLMSVAT